MKKVLRNGNEYEIEVTKAVGDVEGFDYKTTVTLKDDIKRIVVQGTFVSPDPKSEVKAYEFAEKRLNEKIDNGEA